MQTNLKNNSNFFDRISQILKCYGIKNVSEFAKDYLNYESPEKINRLKKPNAKPSFDIIFDISNKFESLSMDWLITGKGNMLKNETKNQNIEEINETEKLRKENEKLKIENQLLREIVSGTVNKQTGT